MNTQKHTFLYVQTSTSSINQLTDCLYSLTLMSFQTHMLICFCVIQKK